MKKYIPFLLLLFVFFLNGCDKVLPGEEEEPDIDTPGVKNPGNPEGFIDPDNPGDIEFPSTVSMADKTVLVYLAADNNLKKFALEDIKEMVAGMKNLDDSRINLIVYSDTGSTPTLFRIRKDNQGTVQKVIIKQYPDQNSVDPDLMASIFSEVFSNYKAANYGLVLWSHADGWLQAPVPKTRYFGQDGNHFMDISDLKTVLQTAPHFDYIYFEACFMAGVEVLYELRPFADYFIACPTEAPGPGAPYDLVLPAMFGDKDSTTDIADIYFKEYERLYADGKGITNENWTGGASLTVVKSSELEKLATASRNYFQENIIRPTTGILCYDKRSSAYHYDLDGLIRLVEPEEINFEKWKSAYDKAVVYFNTTARNYSQFAYMFSMEGATGLSVYIPTSNSDTLMEYYRTYEWYQDVWTGSYVPLRTP